MNCSIINHPITDKAFLIWHYVGGSFRINHQRVFPNDDILNENIDLALSLCTSELTVAETKAFTPLPSSYRWDTQTWNVFSSYNNNKYSFYDP